MRTLCYNIFTKGFKPALRHAVMVADLKAGSYEHLFVHVCCWGPSPWAWWGIKIVNMKIGFVGTGFIGGNLSANFLKRGFEDIILYDRSEHAGNKELVCKQDITFVAVPTPTLPTGFDSSILKEVMDLPFKEGAIVVIKSTVPPHILREIANAHKGKIIMHCPEFLSELTAGEDTDNPDRNIVGISDISDPQLIRKAKDVLAILPKKSDGTTKEFVCTLEEASLAKYAGNCFFYVKNVFFNMLYDLASAYDCNWESLRDMVIGDSRIHPVHTNPVHKGGRGAGNHCLIKDFAAFINMYAVNKFQDPIGNNILRDVEKKNIQLLKSSGKDLDLLEGVYGSL